MDPIQPPSKLELLEDQETPEAPHRRRVILAAVLGAVTLVNVGFIASRYAAPPAVGPVTVTLAGPVVLAPIVEVTALEEPGAPSPVEEVAAATPVYRVVAGRIQRGATVARSLAEAGIDPKATHEIVQALKGTFDFRRAQAGDGFRVKLDADGRVLFFDYERTPLVQYCARREGERLVGFRRKIEVRTERAVVNGVLRSSLYESMKSIGERPSLAILLADVLAWDIDFYREPRTGDRFRIVVEKKMHKGRMLGYGKILAAEYKGEVGTYRIFLFEEPSGRQAYYDAKGDSAQKAFLKAPLKFARITSSYGRRRHPILGYSKMHRGVDYGAPHGTPILSIGDGKVVTAGYKGAAGRMVQIRHANDYVSTYMHLSRIHVKAGQRVHQNNVIGLVGSSGQSTGPHLHYEMKQHGATINPLKIKLPPRRPLPKRLLPGYQKAIEPLLKILDSPEPEKMAFLGIDRANAL